MRTPILLASALVLWQPAATAQPAQGPLAIKLFQFVLGSQIHQSGASFEVLNGSAGDLELGVFSTTGQSIAGMSWRIATADGRFDSGASQSNGATAAFTEGRSPFGRLGSNSTASGTPGRSPPNWLI